MKRQDVHHRSRAIPLSVLVHIAWNNILTKRLRSFLTILGIVIGIATVFFLLSLGLGLTELVTKEILNNQSVRSITIDTPNSKILQLNSTTVDRISALPHVSELSASYTFPTGISYRQSNVQGIVYGIDVSYLTMASISTTSGRTLTKDDTDTALVNRSALKAMGMSDEESILNQKVRITVPLQSSGAKHEKLEKEYTVVGIIDSGAGTEIFVPKLAFSAEEIPVFSDVRLMADDVNAVSKLRGQIESLGFKTASPVDTIDQINQVFRFFTVALVGFGMVSMIVAILGMFNTLTISLLERTKEIALMITLGARSKDMRRLITIEASLLSLIGSVAGVVVAIVLALLINFLLNRLAESRGVIEYFNLFAMPWWLILGTIAFMSLVGLAVVYFPARQAQRVNPIDALRRD